LTEIVVQVARTLEASPVVQDRPEVLASDALGHGREVLGEGEALKSLFEGGDEGGAVAGRAPGRALLAGDEALVTAGASEDMFEVVVGGGQVGDVVASEDLLAEVVGGFQHATESRAAHRRASPRPEVPHLVQEGPEAGLDRGGAGGASEASRRAADHAMEGFDVGRLRLRERYGVAEVLGELLGEDRGVFLARHEACERPQR